MKITKQTIKIKEIIKNYKNEEEKGVYGYDGKLNIRPKYQREFIYNDSQQVKVIQSIQSGFPLNTIYWSVNSLAKQKNQSSGIYELLDGQQRIMSICNYYTNVFMVNKNFFNNLTPNEQKVILDYELDIYIVEGDEAEKLKWFRIINIAGIKLTDQELRNVAYTGTWLTEAKKKFSKRNCPAKDIGNYYLKGNVTRQEYLETALKWITNLNGQKDIETYMARNQHNKDANELWEYFEQVIKWVEDNFKKRAIMKGLPWGFFYNKFWNSIFNKYDLEEEIKKLILDDEVQDKKGIYEYIFTKEEKHLNLRTFSQKIKIEKYEKQKECCHFCKQKFEINEMEADHIIPWSKGGETTLENCQMLCKPCNRKKGNK